MAFWNIFGNMALSDKGETITHLSDKNEKTCISFCVIVAWEFQEKIYNATYHG